MTPHRSLSVDAVRLLAAFGVILIHLAPSTDACAAFTRLFLAFAVPYFLMISLYFFIVRITSLAAPRLADLRLDRLLVPYAVWSAIYTVLRVLKFRLAGRPFVFAPFEFAFYGGAGVQLYFIPLLLLFQALALALIFLGRSSRWRWTGLAVALGAALFGYTGQAQHYAFFDDALARGAVYVALAFLLRAGQATRLGRRVNLFLGWLVIPLIVTTAFFGTPLYALGLLAGPVVGYAVAACALNARFQTSDPLLLTLFTSSYGVYLAHFGFLEGFEFLANRFGVLPIPYSIAAKLCVASGIFLSCLGFISLARRHRLSAYLFLGETTHRLPPRTAR